MTFLSFKRSHQGYFVRSDKPPPQPLKTYNCFYRLSRLPHDQSSVKSVEDDRVRTQRVQGSTRTPQQIGLRVKDINSANCDLVLGKLGNAEQLKKN